MTGRTRREDNPHREAARRLSDRVCARRQALDLSQQALAERAQVSLGTVRAIERRAVVDPGVFTIDAIARALESSVDELLGRSTARRRRRAPREQVAQSATASGAASPRAAARREGG